MTDSGSAYCLGAVKRGFDLSVAFAALVLLTPLLLVVALGVLVSSGPPVLFVQERVGRGGRLFRLLKFRTMSRGAGAGPAITGSGDRRVTAIGRVLRVTKVDELPQLVNVLRGSMSLVGPRPEVPRFVANYDQVQRGVLAVRPGLTDPATVRFRDEESLLGAVDPAGREAYYESEILPRKLEMNLEYIRRAGFWHDLGLLALTAAVIFMPVSARTTWTGRSR